MKKIKIKKILENGFCGHCEPVGSARTPTPFTRAYVLVAHIIRITCVAGFEIPKLQQLSGIIIMIIIYINVLFSRPFLHRAYSSRSLTTITGTVNGKTGIDNLLPAIYKRYVYFFFIHIHTYMYISF